MDVNQINVITLAYMGDAIYEVFIRNEFIKMGICRVDELQKEVVRFVSAHGQALVFKKLMDDGVFTDFELDIVRRGRNYKRSVHPKHTDLATYKMATGFEALIGYLYLSGSLDRLKEIFNRIEVVSCISLGKM